jgi:5-oxoprolinase (ATP-hydrolysing)
VSTGVDQVWCDVGGTFTDCFVVRSSGQRLTTKVLSSGVFKGVAERWIGPETFIDPSRRNDPAGFWIGAEVRWVHDDGTLVASQRCVAFDCSMGTITVDVNKHTGWKPMLRYELVTGLEAPVLATRWLLGCRPTEPLPFLDVRLGTTRGTNALLTRNGEPCALVTTMGFADLVRIGYQERPSLFELTVRKRLPLHHCVVEIPERLAADGSVLRPLDVEATELSLRELYSTGIRSIAVCLLHSYCNPEHEQRVEQIANRIGFTCVCISSRVSPKIKAVLRAETALVDAYLTPIVQGYLARVSCQFGLDGTRRMRVMTSSGGLAANDLVRGKDSVLSGPAGGAVAIAGLAKAMGEPRCIGLDMGGTSTDVCRIDGKLQLEYETIKAGVRMMVPTLAIHTVAAGGGSVCWFDDVSLRVGPHSAGADPGPACYGRGGPLTVTDLNLLSDRIDIQTFPFKLDREAAERRANELLMKVNMTGVAMKAFSLSEVVEGFRRIANEHMAAAVRSISISQGADPRQHALVGFGGAAGQHICEIADLLGITNVIDPPHAGLLSAWGMGMATIQRTLSRPIYQLLSSLDESAIGLFVSELWQSAWLELECEGIARDRIEASFEIELRYGGTEGGIMVELEDYSRWQRTGRKPTSLFRTMAGKFEELHQKRFGYSCPNRTIEAVLIRGEFRSKLESTIPIIQQVVTPIGAVKRFEVASRGVVHRDELIPGQEVAGPSLIVSSGSTTSLPPMWIATVLSDRTLSIRRDSEMADSTSFNVDDTRTEQVDPVLREVLAQRIAAIADQMGIVLEQTAVSVNVKDRRDFSCAVFASNGDLIANAPHVPVHLGAMSQTIRCLLELFPAIEAGDCFVTNDPYQGGSHLPDITVVTPVFVGGSSKKGPPDFFVACRAHHAEIGGVSPGSMAPTSTRLGDEGVVIPPMYLTRGGEDRSMDVQKRLGEGRFPSRSIPENMSDLAAQQAANQCGAHAMVELAERAGLEVIKRYLEHIQQASEAKTRAWIQTLPTEPQRFTDQMDDGTGISVAIQRVLDSQGRSKLRIDFAGTGETARGNLNANPAIVSAAVMYVIRCALADSLPLNSGVMRCVELLVPEGILNPRCVGDRDDWPAVAGGNVETSQRVVDCLLGALGLAAASQGTMNNFLFGDSSFGYYETIGGGTGATTDGVGADAVHSHMTNTRLTDVEVLEKKYPVRLVRFEIRRGSGGAGRHPGGNGLTRQVQALRPLEVSLVTSRRTTAPFGMNGGQAGKPGENWLVRADGQRVRLGSSVQVSIEAGESILIETPGGGGMGECPEFILGGSSSA